MKLLMVTLSVSALNFTNTISSALKNQTIFNIRKQENNSELSVFFWQAKAMMLFLQKHNIAFEILDKNYYWFSTRLRRQAGLLACLMLSTIMLGLFSCFVFQVEIIGATAKSYESILAVIKSEHVLPISLKSKLQNSNISSTLMQNIDALSFASCMIRGATLFISVKEKTIPQEMEFSTFLPLRATNDGIVEQVEVFQGTASVKVGDFVKAGESVIMPFVFLSSGEKKDVVANGLVVLRCFAVQSVDHITIGERNVRTGKTICERKIAIWDKMVYHATASNTFEQYETVVSHHKLSLGNLLPIRYTQLQYFETVKELFSSPFENVREKTFLNLKQKCHEMLESNSEILREFSTEQPYSTFVRATYVIEFEKRIS